MTNNKSISFATPHICIIHHYNLFIYFLDNKRCEVDVVFLAVKPDKTHNSKAVIFIEVNARYVIVECSHSLQ